MNTQDEITMFGTPLGNIKRLIASLDESGIKHYTMGLVSDAQESILRGDKEEARQVLNTVKYIMSERGFK